MVKRAIVFVDANNWYHSVKKYFDPGEVDITKVADFLCTIKGYSLAEIRWYASVPSINDGERMYYRHMSFLESLKKKGVRVITRKLQRLSNQEILQRKKETIDSLDLCKNCKPLIESVFLDLADIKKKEKGIDVWIAVDMILHSVILGTNDVCILISGDADFVPALMVVQKQRKEILSASVPWGYSTELRNKFPYFILKKEVLMKCFRTHKEAPG